MIRYAPKQYDIHDFLEWWKRDELELSPKFQRRKVWSDKARSYLIDTILSGLPMPKIFMRQVLDPVKQESIKEVVDGQQRLDTIIRYVDDEFKVSKVHSKDFGGKYYSDLPEAAQAAFLEYTISVDVLYGAEDSHVLDIFARLNTYTVKLNRQELLNAKYLGAFKREVYELAHEYANYWVVNKVLTNNNVARMLEAELTSELVIQVINRGVEDRKNIEKYYKLYEDDFPGSKAVMLETRRTIELIAQIFYEELRESKFRLRPLYYSLFGVLNGYSGKIKRSNYTKVRQIIYNIEEIFYVEEEFKLRKRDINFIDASTKHVTDLRYRMIRHKYLKDELGKLLK